MSPHPPSIHRSAITRGLLEIARLGHLWTGTSLKEFQVWRVRYSGGLTAIEEAFAEATLESEARRSRRRRVATTAIFAVLLIILGIMSGLYRHSEQARQLARQAPAPAGGGASQTRRHRSAARRPGAGPCGSSRCRAPGGYGACG